MKYYNFLLNVPFSTETLSGVLSQYLLFLLCTEKCMLLNRQFLKNFKTSTSYWRYLYLHIHQQYFLFCFRIYDRDAIRFHLFYCFREYIFILRLSIQCLLAILPVLHLNKGSSMSFVHASIERRHCYRVLWPLKSSS